MIKIKNSANCIVLEVGKDDCYRASLVYGSYKAAFRYIQAQAEAKNIFIQEKLSYSGFYKRMTLEGFSEHIQTDGQIARFRLVNVYESTESPLENGGE